MQGIGTGTPAPAVACTKYDNVDQIKYTVAWAPLRNDIPLHNIYNWTA